jgi:hypothetical protein
LAGFPQVTQSVDLHCVTRWTKLDVPFGGIRLADVLERANVCSEARFVSFVARSARNHSSSLPLADALSLGTLIATSAGGQPLTEEHGGPIRGVVPGRYFYKSVKWLEAIELLAENRLGFWEATAGYHDHADPWLEERYMAPSMDRREARQLIESRDFAGRDLRSIDCSRRDLTALSANGAQLRDANFTECGLTKADFRNANLSNARFTGADLQGASFEGADLEGAEFTGADIRGVNFQACSWFGTTFCQLDEQGKVVRGATLDRSTRMDEAALSQLTEAQRSYVVRLTARN